MSGAATKIPRSRQTVVCTECKRLKVKCDKLSPCSQCAKRSNDPRVCVYLTANTERPDINVLWNNQREADSRIETLAIRVDEIHDSYLPRRITMPPLVIMASHMGSATVHPLDSITALWVTTLGIPTTRVEALVTNGLLPPTSRLFDSQEASNLYPLFFSTESVSGSRRRRAVVTFDLLQQLPSNMTCDTFITSLNSTLILHPICSSMHHLETRMRTLYDPQHGLKLTTDIPVSFFAVAAAAMTLGSLTYQTERKAWKMQPEFPESEQDITKLFDLAKIAISLAGETEDDQNDVMLALLLLIIFTLHSREMDGYKAVVSGVAPSPIRQQLGQLIDTLRRKADMSGLLSELPTAAQSSLWSRESRRSLAAAVAFYDFLVSDLIGTKVTLDGTSYTTEAPAPVDGRYFKPASHTIPTPTGNIYHSSTFATYRARLLKSLLQARAEIVYLREQERALMIAAAEASNQGGDEEKNMAHKLPRTAGDSLEQWDERLHQIQENLPPAMSFDTSVDYSAEVAYVFSGEQKVPSTSEPSVTLAMGYGIAQQTELSALTAYYRMRFAALLLENAIIYKPRGSPPSANMTVAALRVLDAAQTLVHIMQVQRHVLKKKMPLCLSSYIYGKRIFDTGVIFAIVCTIPSSRTAERKAMQAAADGLAQCIELLKDLETWLRVKEGLPDPTSQPAVQDLSPPLRVLEHLAERVGVKIVDGVVESVDPRRKRNMVDLDEADGIWEGLILPYVMGGYAVGKAPDTKSWIGHQENVPAPTRPAPTVQPITVPVAPIPSPKDEHRDKRVCLPTNVHGIVMPLNNSTSLLELAQTSPEEFANSIGRKRPSNTTPAGMRPVSATNPARPAIAVRARVKEVLKRPKRKVLPVTEANGDGSKEKSESPMDSIDEDYTDQFAFNLSGDKSEEYQQQQQQQQQFMGQISTSQSSQQQQVSQNELALSLDAPSHPSQRQPQPQQPQVSIVENKQLNVLGDSSSSNDSPETPHLNPAAGSGQSYSADSWAEMGAVPTAYGQPIISSQGYSGNNMILSQSGDASSYVHHQGLQQQHQHQHHQHHQQATTQPAQTYHHLPHAHHHVHPPPSQHKVAISYVPQHQLQEYPHPQQVQMHSAHGHAHAQYSQSAGYNRPHPLVIDGMSMGQTQAGPGSQPPSAVTMGEANTYYAASVNATPIQSVPSSMFGGQHEYAQSWHPSQGQDYYSYN